MGQIGLEYRDKTRQETGLYAEYLELGLRAKQWSLIERLVDHNRDNNGLYQA